MVGLPPMLADMAIGAFKKSAQLELIASEQREPPEGIEALLTARSPAVIESLLWKSPHVHAFVIGRDSRTVRIRICPVREDLGELSFAELCAAIATSVRRARRVRRARSADRHHSERDQAFGH
jgi:hypothetical protein